MHSPSVLVYVHFDYRQPVGYVETTTRRTSRAATIDINARIYIINNNNINNVNSANPTLHSLNLHHSTTIPP